MKKLPRLVLAAALTIPLLASGCAAHRQVYVWGPGESPTTSSGSTKPIATTSNGNSATTPTTQPIGSGASTTTKITPFLCPLPSPGAP